MISCMHIIIKIVFVSIYTSLILYMLYLPDTAELYPIDSYVRFEMDFKTTRQDGVIISISTYRDSPGLALEMHNGWVRFNANHSSIYKYVTIRQ